MKQVRKMLLTCAAMLLVWLPTCFSEAEITQGMIVDAEPYVPMVAFLVGFVAVMLLPVRFFEILAGDRWFGDHKNQ